MLHVSYPSRMLPMNPRYIRTSSRWWVLLWKDYWWFQVGLSNFDFRQIWHFTIHVRDYPHAMTISIMYHTQIPQRIWCWGFGAADKMHHMKGRFMQCFITISLWQNWHFILTLVILTLFKLCNFSIFKSFRAFLKVVSIFRCCEHFQELCLEKLWVY